MAKTQENPEQVKESKIKKDTKDKNSDALVGRVKKVIKKSRRKMGDEKFEKQLQRTIAFLEEFQRKMAVTENTEVAKKTKPAKKSKTEKAGRKSKPKSKADAEKAASGVKKSR